MLSALCGPVHQVEERTHSGTNYRTRLAQSPIDDPALSVVRVIGGATVHGPVDGLELRAITEPRELDGLVYEPLEVRVADLHQSMGTGISQNKYFVLVAECTGEGVRKATRHCLARGSGKMARGQRDSGGEGEDLRR